MDENRSEIIKNIVIDIYNISVQYDELLNIKIK